MATLTITGKSSVIRQLGNTIIGSVADIAPNRDVSIVIDNAPGGANTASVTSPVGKKTFH